MSQTYPVVLALGCLAGLVWLAMRRGQSAEAEPAAFEAGLAALAAGLIGARLAFAAVHPALFARPAELFYLWQGGLSGPGAMAGAVAGVGAYAALRRLPFRPLADAVALPGLVVGFAAWAGCTLEGCVYGMETSAGTFALPVPDIFGVVAPRWPTAPAGLAAAGLLTAASIGLAGRPLAPGRTAALALGGLAVISFALSFTRADPALLMAGVRVDGAAAAAVLLLAAGLYAASPREA